MTTIAYKSGILACDSAWTCNETFVSSHTKLVRLASGAIFATAGEGDDRALLALVKDAACSEHVPDSEALDAITNELQALLIFPDGNVWLLLTGEDSDAMQIHDEHCAIGSGWKLALAAMDAGASAERAIEIACKRDVYTRSPVHTLELIP